MSVANVRVVPTVASKLRVDVAANVRGRHLGSFVIGAEAAGYCFGWGGEFEQLVSAYKLLAIVVQIAFALIALLLFTSLGSAEDAAILITGVLLALAGGVAGVALRDNTLSISAGGTKGKLAIAVPLRANMAVDERRDFMAAVLRAISLR
jgi:Cu/Ag efflux pump CusA